MGFYTRGLKRNINLDQQIFFTLQRNKEWKVDQHKKECDREEEQIEGKCGNHPNIQV